MVKVVLIPFARANSIRHVTSTKGGEPLDDPELEQLISDKERQLVDLREIRDRSEGVFKDPARTHLAKGRQMAFASAPAVGLDQLQGRAAQLAFGARAPAIMPSEAQASSSSKFLGGRSQLGRYETRLREVEADIARLKAARPGWKGITDNEIVCSDSPNIGAVLSTLRGENDVLYIRGHCDAGGNFIESSNHQETKTYKELVDLLKLHLNAGFRGIIKLYGCRTSVDIDQDNKSFGYRFLKSFFKTWPQARVFGYSRAMHTWVVSADGHKTSTSNERAKLMREEIQRPQALAAPETGR